MKKHISKSLKVLEALIFASAEPISYKILKDKMPDDTDLSMLLNELQDHYADRGVNLVSRGKGWVFRTNPSIADALTVEKTVTRKLSRAAIETLAICAYHQPITLLQQKDLINQMLQQFLLILIQQLLKNV